jgi:hypothetical protein
MPHNDCALIHYCMSAIIVLDRCGTQVDSECGVLSSASHRKVASIPYKENIYFGILQSRVLVSSDD